MNEIERKIMEGFLLGRDPKQHFRDLVTQGYDPKELADTARNILERTTKND